MAQIGPSPPIDPNVLFGAGPQNAWWQSSNTASPKPPIDPGKGRCLTAYACVWSLHEQAI
jgi:hypothetical protein